MYGKIIYQSPTMKDQMYLLFSFVILLRFIPAAVLLKQEETGIIAQKCGNQIIWILCQWLSFQFKEIAKVTKWEKH